MNRYSDVKDLTEKRNAPSPGAALRRLCWACNKPKSDLGGKTDKRTRAWHCAGCVRG